MTRRRTVLVLMLAGLFLVVIAAVLGATGPSGGRLKTPAVGAAIALFGAGIVQTLVSTALGRRHQDKAELERGLFMPGGKPPLVRNVANPLTVGVHGAARSSGTNGADRRLPPMCRATSIPNCTRH